MAFKEMDDKLWELVRPYLPPQIPKMGRPRVNLRKSFNGILYVLKTGCTWEDTPRIYGIESTIHRLHIGLAKNGVYGKIFGTMIYHGYNTSEIDISRCFTDTKDIPAKGGKIGYDGNKKVKGVKISALVDNDGLPLSIVVAPANIHDSKFCLLTIERLKIKIPIGRPITRPGGVMADAAYDSEEIRKYNRKRGIKTNIPVNEINRMKRRVGRPIKYDKEEYKKRNAVERFFRWIGLYKRIFLKYEQLEVSYLGLVQLACAMMLWRVLG